MPDNDNEFADVLRGANIGRPYRQTVYKLSTKQLPGWKIGNDLAQHQAEDSRSPAWRGWRGGAMTAAPLRKQNVVDDLAASLSALDAHELNLQALEIMADWREDLTMRVRRAGLKLELIGGDDDSALAFEVAEFKRCCRCLGWRR